MKKPLANFVESTYLENIENIQKMKLDFVIVGGMKCGSTAVGTYFSQHPDVNFCNIIETNYFSRGSSENVNLKDYFKIFYKEKKGLRGESSPTYSHPNNLPMTAEKLKKNFPDLKVILIVRNPYKRIESHLNHLKLNGKDLPDDLEECIKLYPNLIENSRFGYIAREYLRVFGEKLLVVKFDDIVLGDGLLKMCNFLGLSVISEKLPLANKTELRYKELPLIKFYKKHWLRFRKIPLLQRFKKPLRVFIEKTFSEQLDIEKNFLNKMQKKIIFDLLKKDMEIFRKNFGYSPFDLRS